MSFARTVVVGTTGSGKSTLASRLAAAIGVRHVELDVLFWQPGWQSRRPEDFAEHVRREVRRDAWVIDGNYSSVRSIIWERATAIVWLNYAFSLTFVRLLRRTLTRLVTREEICNGNRESFVGIFLSRQSLLLWAIRSHPRYRREYPLALKRYPDVRLHEFRRPSETEAFLSRLEHDQLTGV
jgi:adenylate kinase family enzyme